MFFKRLSLIGVLAPFLLFADPALAATDCNGLFADRHLIRDQAKAAHDSISADLYTGRIVSIRPFKENDNRNLLFLVKVEAHDPYTGQVRHRDAFFKPSLWGDNDGYARAGMEYLAYPLNLKLGMDAVPPTAYRRQLGLQINGAHFEQGALIFKVPDYTPMAGLHHEKFNGGGDLHAAIVSDHRILSVLLQNGDGHYWNIGQGRHWVDGEIRPVFIDWGASLRRGTNATLTRYPAFGNSEPVERVRAQTLNALRALDRKDMDEFVEGRFISAAEADFILSIRDGIVSYFERLIRERGTERVLIPL